MQILARCQVNVAVPDFAAVVGEHDVTAAIFTKPMTFVEFAAGDGGFPFAGTDTDVNRLLIVDRMLNAVSANSDVTHIELIVPMKPCGIGNWVKQIIQRFPDFRIARTIKGGLWPCSFAPQRCTGPFEIKRHLHQVARDQRVAVKKNERLTFGQGKQCFDLVSDGIALTENPALKRNDFGPKVAQSLQNGPVAYGRVVVPVRAVLRNRNK